MKSRSHIQPVQTLTGDRTSTTLHYSPPATRHFPPSTLYSPLSTVYGLAMLAVGFLLLLGRLDYALLEPDESRYAELPRLMVRTGDWLTPRLEGEPYNDKPPLVYWLTAVGYLAFGPQQWVGRAVCGLFGIVTLVSVYLWARHYLGRGPALLAVLVLETMVGFLVLSRMLLLDSVLAGCVLAALFAGHHALSGPTLRWRWWLASAVLCGLGVLAKGPVAGVLVVPALFMLRWLQPGSVRWGFGPAVAYAAISLGLAAPWYAAMLLTNDGFAGQHFWRHHVQRFVDPFHHGKPFWYYGPIWFGELLPWSSVALLAVSTWRRWPGSLRFVAFNAVWTFAFFTAAKGKLPTYLLPMLPLNALIVGWYLDQWRRGEVGGHAPRWLVGIALLALIAAMVVKEPLALHLFGQEYDAVSLLPLAAVPLAAAGLFVRERSLALNCLLAAGLGMSFALAWQAVPDFANEASRGQPAAAMAAWAEARGIPVVAFRNAWPGASFYRGADELPVFHKEDEAALWKYVAERAAVMILIRHEEDQLADLARALPAGYEVAKLFNRPTVYGVLVRRSETK